MALREARKYLRSPLPGILKTTTTIGSTIKGVHSLLQGKVTFAVSLPFIFFSSSLFPNHVLVPLIMRSAVFEFIYINSSIPTKDCHQRRVITRKRQPRNVAVYTSCSHCDWLIYMHLLYFSPTTILSADADIINGFQRRNSPKIQIESFEFTCLKVVSNVFFDEV